MAFKNILSYKLKRVLPILGLMGATLTGCEKDEYYFVLPPCQCPQQPGDKDDSDDDKKPGDNEDPGTEDPKPEIKTHETTYVWGRIRMNSALIKNICASADSVEVSRVILANDGDTFGNVMSDKYIKENYIDYVINKVTPENRHKVCGANTLIDVVHESKKHEEGLKALGFDIRYGDSATTTAAAAKKNNAKDNVIVYADTVVHSSTTPPLRYAMQNYKHR